MSDDLQMAVGLLVPMLAIVGTLLGTLVAIAAIGSTWGLLLFMTWPFIAVGVVMFVLWWDGR